MRLASLLFGGAVLLFAGSAAAYTLDSAVGDPCHEALASEALRVVRTQTANAPTIDPNSEDMALIADVPFALASTADLAVATLLLGVRDNDLQGNGAQELDSLPSVHGDPSLQRQHCLRHPTHDGEEGNELALRECRAFITERFNAALKGLDQAGRPDPNHRTRLTVTLAIRGEIDVDVPTFWLEMGRALHAVQDGFTHTYRTPDGRRVSAVLNWVDVVNDDYVASRDGPAHSMELDRCDDPDELRAERRRLATEASVAVLAAALQADDGAADRGEALERVLDDYFEFEPGCNAENQWCDAPEADYADDTGCACSVPRSTTGSSSVGWGAMGLLLAAIRRRRRTTLAKVVGMHGAVPPTVIALSLVTASFANAATPSGDEQASGDGKVQAEVEPTVIDTEEPPWDPKLGVQATFAASYDNPAMAGSVSANYRLTQAWIAGVTAEYNPFISLNGETFRTGVFNGYLSFGRQFPMRFESLSVYTFVHAGTSVLLEDLVGAPAGSAGLFIGATPIGVSWRINRWMHLLLSPITLALPIPQLDGVPFAYGQYRTAIGVEVLVL